MGTLACFKAYDIRGEIGLDIDVGIAYRIGRAVAQHFNSKLMVIGFDARESSPNFAAAVSDGARDAGSDVINIGLAGTEEMYWAVTHFGASAGIEVTASHNPINYNGMKIVKSGSQPLDDILDFQAIRKIAESDIWEVEGPRGAEFERASDARNAYVAKILSFVDISSLAPLKIVVNSGNGAAGPTFDAIASHLDLLKFVRVHHDPDCRFPNGIPNPLLSKNHAATAEIVKKIGADFGIAFDGDFDRCFFFDGDGRFVPGEYIVGLLASVFLVKEKEATIVHDPRVIWNTQEIVSSNGGVAVQSKTGHAFIKHTMRACGAIYGGEMSAHHYFRDFAFCDSGMIPWLLVAELVSTSKRSLRDLVKERFVLFPSSGETNFVVEDVDDCIDKVLSVFRDQAICIDYMDGVSLTFQNWRFNLRASNTEHLVRLNIETKGNAADLMTKINAISDLIDGVRH